MCGVGVQSGSAGSFINFASSFLVEFCFVILCTVRLDIASHGLLYFA